MQVTVIGGGGTIGSTTGYTIANEWPTVDIVFSDVDEKLSWGHSTDIRHSRYHTAHTLGPNTKVGSINSVEPGTEAVSSADYVVVTASVPRQEGGDEPGGRSTYWPANRDIADQIADWLSSRDPIPVLVVTNPVDLMVYRLWQQTGWPRSKFIGYSLSESARAAEAIARLTDADPSSVGFPIIGEHGHHIVPVYSHASIGGEPVDFSSETRKSIEDFIRTIPYDIIQKRGKNHSSRWVTSRGIAHVIGTLLDGETSDTVCLSTPLMGEYGIEEVALSVPLRLSSEGIVRIEEWDLAPSEYDKLKAASGAVKNVL